MKRKIIKYVFFFFVAFACSDQLSKQITNGLEFTDSITINGHKSLLISLGCSLLYLKNSINKNYLIKSLSLDASIQGLAKPFVH